MSRNKKQTDADATPTYTDSVTIAELEIAEQRFNIVRFNKFNPDEKTYLKEYTFYNTFLPEYAKDNASAFTAERAETILTNYADNIIEPEPNIEYQMQVVNE